MVQEGTKVEDGATPVTETAETPKTFTEDEVKKQVRDARSAALAEIGKLRTESERSVKLAQAAQVRLDKLLKEQEDAELAAADGNPEQLSAVQERLKRRRAEAELDQVKTELDTHKTRIQEIESERETIKLEQTVNQIAGKFNVSPERLSSLVKRFKEVTPEAIEDLAQDLPKIQTPTPIKTDSNVSTSGGGGKLTPEKLRGMSPEDLVKNAKEIAKLPLSI